MGSDLVLVALSVVVRAVALVSKWFITRPEVATPLNSWNRLTEGVHLYKSGIKSMLMQLLSNIYIYI